LRVAGANVTTCLLTPSYTVDAPVFTLLYVVLAKVTTFLLK